MRRHDTIAATLLSLTHAFGTALVSEQVARRPGLLQAFDPRVRVIGLFALVLAVILSHRISVIVALFVVAVLLAVLSQVNLKSLAIRVWLMVLLFTSVIALPSVFLTPGDPIVTFPAGALHITAQGVTTAVLLITRVETATPWMQILKALRAFRIPQEVVMMLAMTHRYIFLLAETAAQMFESRQSRTVGVIAHSAARHMTTRTGGVLLSKSVELSNDVFLAMQSRGFRGDAKTLSEFRMRSLDYIGLLSFLLVGVVAVWVGRA